MKEANNAIRFLMEIAALVTFGIWGYRQSDSGLGILFAIGLPLVFALLWGVFAVRDDPSRSGKTVVQTPGWARLILEVLLFSLSVWMLLDMNYFLAGIIFGSLLVMHYAVSYKRILWLIKQPSK